MHGYETDSEPEILPIKNMKLFKLALKWWLHTAVTDISSYDIFIFAAQNIYLHELDMSKPRDIYAFARTFAESGSSLHVLVWDILVFVV